MAIFTKIRCTIILLLIISITFSPSVLCERILFVLPLATQSETHLFTPLAKELALMGHDITIVTPANSNIKMKNYKEIVPVPPIDFSNFYKNIDPIEARRLSQDKLSWIGSSDFEFVFDLCHKVFQNPDFQKLFKESFDLIIFSANFNNCFEGLVHTFQAPFIFFGSMPVSGDVAQLTGIRMPASFVPNPMLGYTDDMTFSDRVVNFLFHGLFSTMYYTIMSSRNTEIYRKYLGQDIPEMTEIEANVSIVFSNSHFSLNNPRPTMNDLIEIGGLHCRDPQPLPKELDDWLSDGKDGFIYFSLGTVLKGVSIAESTRKMFINVFSRLKHIRVLWKWETEQMSDLPANVKLVKWVSQQDVLGHKNIRIFISHGGLLSTQESAYHGVPVIGIPFFVDQDINMIKAEKLGFSLRLEILELTEEKLEAAINEIFENPKYLKNAKESSKIFRDRPESPLSLALYWINYVVKHKGAIHLRSIARKLSFFQYYSLDVIGFLLSIILTVFGIFIALFKICCCRGTNSNDSSKKKRQ